VPRASGHARGRVSTLNRVLARQEKEIIETALEECYGQVSGPIRRRHELGLPARTLDSKIKRFKINNVGSRFQGPVDPFPFTTDGHSMDSASPGRSG
jgi:DNA-binding NtrC family response regulator